MMSIHPSIHPSMQTKPNPPSPHPAREVINGSPYAHTHIRTSLSHPSTHPTQPIHSLSQSLALSTQAVKNEIAIAIDMDIRIARIASHHNTPRRAAPRRGGPKNQKRPRDMEMDMSPWAEQNDSCARERWREGSDSQFTVEGAWHGMAWQGSLLTWHERLHCAEDAGLAHVLRDTTVEYWCWSGRWCWSRCEFVDSGLLCWYGVATSNTYGSVETSFLDSRLRPAEGSVCDWGVSHCSDLMSVLFRYLIFYILDIRGLILFFPSTSSTSSISSTSWTSSTSSSSSSYYY